jgi:hypothetical protein
LPQHLERFVQAPLAGLIALRLVDPAGVLLAMGEGQPVECGACLGVLGESFGERFGHLDLPWGGVELDLDLERVAGLDTASSRTARFRPSRNSPRMRVTVVRQV